MGSACMGGVCFKSNACTKIQFVEESRETVFPAFLPTTQLILNCENLSLFCLVKAVDTTLYSRSYRMSEHVCSRAVGQLRSGKQATYSQEVL